MLPDELVEIILLDFPIRLLRDGTVASVCVQWYRVSTTSKKIIQYMDQGWIDKLRDDPQLLKFAHVMHDSFGFWPTSYMDYLCLKEAHATQIQPVPSLVDELRSVGLWLLAAVYFLVTEVLQKPNACTND